MRDREHQIQVACVNYFRYTYPEVLIWAIPNGGARNAVVAAKLKAEGVLAGVPDLFVAAARGGFHGLFIEMKAGKNKPTNEQTTIMARLETEHYKTAVCYSLDEFMAAVDGYLS